MFKAKVGRKKGSLWKGWDKGFAATKRHRFMKKALSTGGSKQR